MSHQNQQGRFHHADAQYLRRNHVAPSSYVDIRRAHDVGDRHAARIQDIANRERQRNGASEILNLRRINPEFGENQTRTVEVTIRGLYEVTQGRRTVVSRMVSHQHFFRIHDVQSDEDLKEGVQDAFRELESMISNMDGDSGYRLFVPTMWHAHDSFSLEEIRQRVHIPTEIHMHAAMPVQYKFLEQLGVSTEEIEQNDSMNCLTSKLLAHMEKHKIMIRHKWTEEKIARVMMCNKADDEDAEVPTGRGFSVKECMRFMDSHKKFNCYAFDQYGNVLMKTEYSGDNNVGKSPFLFVCHNAHCYQITDEEAITSHVQRIRAASKENTEIFKREKAEEKRLAKEQALVKLLQRDYHTYSYTQGQLDLNHLDRYKDCNLFVNAKCLEPMLLEIFQKTNFIHTGNYVKSSFMRLNYKNGVVLFANPNPKSKINTSYTSRILADRLKVPFKNQSIGAIAVEFCNIYFNPKGGKTKRLHISVKERQRHADRFKNICQICQIKCDKFHLDHIVRLEFGGDNSDENIQLLCAPCHESKTKREVGQSLFSSDQTISHYNKATMEIFSRIKTGLIHNFVDYKEYATLDMHQMLDENGDVVRDQNGNDVMKPVLTKKDDGSVIVALDHNKNRTNIVRYEMAKYMFLVFSLLCDPQHFDRKNAQHVAIPPGEYWVTTDNVCPARGNDFYSYIMVRRLLEKRQITLKDIKYFVTAPKDLCLPGNYFTPFVEQVLKRVICCKDIGSKEWKREVGVAKECINQFIGMLGIRTSDHKSVDLFTSMEAASLHASKRQEGSTTAEIPVLKNQPREVKGKISLMNHGHHVTVMPRVFDSNDDDNYEKGMLKRADYYSVVSQSTVNKTESMMPLFRCILDVEAIVLDDSKRLGEEFGRVLCINVDCVYVQLFSDKNGTAMEKAERLRKKAEKICWYNSDVKKYNKMEFTLPKPTIIDRKIIPSEEKLIYNAPEYEVLDDPGFTDKEGAMKWAKTFVNGLLNEKKDLGCMISSLAGTGKTFLTNCVISELQRREINFLAIAPTHVAAHLLGGIDENGKHTGKTIHAALSIMKNGNFSSFKKYKVIIVDEFSMVSEMHWAALAKLKRQYSSIRFLLVGNWAQLESVGARSSSFDFENAGCIHELVNGRKLVLTICRRADKGGQELFKQYKYIANSQYEKFDASKFGDEEHDLSIAYYNSTVKAVNDKWMERYKPKEHMIVKASMKAKTLFNCQNITLYDRMPLMACQTRESLGFFNCETWKVKSWNSNEVKLVSDDELPEKRYAIIPTPELADLFRPGYCITSHRAQGKTIRRPYTIYDFARMNNRAAYVAISRGTAIKSVNISYKNYGKDDDE